MGNKSTKAIDVYCARAQGGLALFFHASLRSEELSTTYGMTPQQTERLVQAFKAELKGKSTVLDAKGFVRMCVNVRAADPGLIPWEDELSELMYTYADTDHDGKVDAFELLAAISVFSGGPSKADHKAELVFKVIDRDGSNTLTKGELEKFAQRVRGDSALWPTCCWGSLSLPLVGVGFLQGPHLGRHQGRADGG